MDHNASAPAMYATFASSMYYQMAGPVLRVSAALHTEQRPDLKALVDREYARLSKFESLVGSEYQDLAPEAARQLYEQHWSELRQIASNLVWLSETILHEPDLALSHMYTYEMQHLMCLIAAEQGVCKEFAP